MSFILKFNKTMSSQHNKIIEYDELVDRNRALYDKGIELDASFTQNNQSFKEVCLELKDNLEKLILSKAPGYNYPVNAIVSTIVTTFQKMGMSSTGIKRIYDVFAPEEYNDYKLHIYHHELQNQNLDTIKGMGEMTMANLKIKEAIAVIKANPDNAAVMSLKQELAKEEYKKEVKQRREREESEKIRIPLPDWIDKEKGGADSETLQALLNLNTTIKQCCQGVFRWPPATDKDDEFYADGINTLTKAFEPGADAKYARDTLSYLDIVHERYSQSDHSAESKSKIQTARGDFRGMTREQIAAFAEKWLLFCHDALEKLPGVYHFNMYLREVQKRYSADWRILMHPKLSESAFGNSSLLEDDKGK